MTPQFAVVGHPNKGKSSIVATLAEQDRIPISPLPGTTRDSRHYAFVLDDECLYELIDTPGFQRARECMIWLEQHSRSVSDRSDTVGRFVETFGDDPHFHDECELLRPLIEGAGILYVVDGSKPYGTEYEIEMQILRWTGRPRMALINLIGTGDYVDKWRHALDQYFSIVRVFDALHADMDKRLELLDAFSHLHEPWKPALDRACAALVAEQARRTTQSAKAIVELLVYALTRARSESLPDSSQREALAHRMNELLKNDLRSSEAQCRDRVEALYRHFHIETLPDTQAILKSDLFAEDGWMLFGLSRRQLLITGALSGAVAGSGIDLVFGGASLMLGAGVGATIGTLGAIFGAGKLASVKILGQPLGGAVLQVGPVKEPNFPWVLLGRAWLHFRLISERNHARREALALDAAAAEHLVETLPVALRRNLQNCFVLIRENSEKPGLFEQLENAIAQVLETEVVSVP